MIVAALLGGWGAALAAALVAAGARRSLTSRAEVTARACHELRGPLTAVRLGVELAARGGELSGPRLRAIELELGRAALALGDLDGAGECQPAAASCEQVDVGSLLRDSVEAWRDGAAARGVRLRLRWRGGCAVVAGERLRLAQATGNLIANAIEHGASHAVAAGGGLVEVRGRAEGASVRIEVADDGPGLSAPVGELARRARRGQARGRGLAIAAAVIAGHGGRLAAAPSDRGASLVVELPAAVVQPGLQGRGRV